MDVSTGVFEVITDISVVGEVIADVSVVDDVAVVTCDAVGMDRVVLSADVIDMVDGLVVLVIGR